MGIAQLDGVIAKLRRSKEHFDAADSEVRAFASQYANSVLVKLRREEMWYVIYVDPLPPFPQHIALVAGDGLNNLRAVLDHLVWQLVLREDQEPDEWNSFPICTGEKQFFDKAKMTPKKMKRHSLHGLPVDGEAWALIKGAQPFLSAHPQDHPLRRLAQLTNIDKHRTLLVQQQAPNWQSMKKFLSLRFDAEIIEEKLSLSPLSLEQPTEIARFRFPPGVDVGMDVNTTFVFSPLLGDEKTCVTRREVQLMADCVMDLLNKVTALPRVQT